MRNQRPLSFNWLVLFQWIMVTTVGWVLGTILLPPIDLAVSGIVIGLLQAIILQSYISRMRHWILASAVGWTTGWALALAVVPNDFSVLAGIVLGLAVGVSQWLVLRREVHWAGWWIAISTLAWAAGMGLTPGFLMTGVTAGAITGLALDLLLQNRRPPEPFSPSQETP